MLRGNCLRAVPGERNVEQAGGILIVTANCTMFGILCKPVLFPRDGQSISQSRHGLSTRSQASGTL
jgi:hypothetical protein